MSLADLRSNVARVTIGLFASLIFSVPFTHMVRFLGLRDYSFVEGFLRNFLSVISATLFALQVVDVLIRHYGRRR